MDCSHSEVSVPLYPRWGLFKVEYINGVTTISLRHSAILSSTTETAGTEKPDTNSSCVSSVHAINHLPISQQQEPNSDSKEGCSFCQKREQNLDELLIFERELLRRGFHTTQQSLQQIPQRDLAFTEKHNQVLQRKSAKRSNKILQLESSKELKQDDSKSSDLRLAGSSGWCSVCKIDCKSKKAVKEHILGKKHGKVLKKLKDGEINENLEKNEKQVEEGDVPQKKRKRTPNTNKQTINCNACDKVFNAQDCFESHLAGKKHAKQLKIMESSKVSSKVKDDSKKFEQPESSKKLKEDNSNSPDLQLPGSSGCCSVCPVDCKSKKALEEHIMGKKHRKMLKKLKEGEINEDLEENVKQVKEGDLPQKKRKRTSNTNGQTITCNASDKVFNTQDCFESQLAGKKHAKQLKIMESSKVSSKVKNDGKKCGDADKIELITESGLLVEDDVTKKAKLKHTGKAKDDSISTAGSDKLDLKVNAMLKDQDQERKKKTDISSNKHKISKKSSTFSKRECKTCNAKLYVEADFEAHFKGKRHARMLKVLEMSKSSLERKGDGEECANVDSKGSESSDLRLPTKDNADKTIEEKTVFNLKNGENLIVNNYRNGQRDDAEIKEIVGVKVDVPDGGENKFEVRDEKDVQRKNAEINWIVGVSDGEDQKLEVEVRNDYGVPRESREIKQVEVENIDVPNGEDNKFEVVVRDDKENIKSEFGAKKDNKMDIEVVAITDLKESVTPDDGQLVKDVQTIAKDNSFEVKDNGGLEVHGMKDGL